MNNYYYVIIKTKALYIREHLMFVQKNILKSVQYKNFITNITKAKRIITKNWI